MLTENETIGAARGRRNNRLERQARMDHTQTPTADTNSNAAAMEGLDRGARRLRNESRFSWQPLGGSVNLGTASTASTTSRSSRQVKAKETASLAGSPGDKGAASAASRKPREKRAPKKVSGIFGIPVGWSAEDYDYDDSEDETYTPPLPRNSYPARGAGARSTRCCSSRKPMGIHAIVGWWHSLQRSTILSPSFGSTS